MTFVNLSFSLAVMGPQPTTAEGDATKDFPWPGCVQKDVRLLQLSTCTAQFLESPWIACAQAHRPSRAGLAKLRKRCRVWCSRAVDGHAWFSGKATSSPETSNPEMQTKSSRFWSGCSGCGVKREQLALDAKNHAQSRHRSFLASQFWPLGSAVE